MMKSIIVGASVLFILIVSVSAIKRRPEMCLDIVVFVPFLASIVAWFVVGNLVGMTSPVSILITFIAFSVAGCLLSLETIERLMYGESFILQ